MPPRRRRASEARASYPVEWIARAACHVSTTRRASAEAVRKLAKRNDVCVMAPRVFRRCPLALRRLRVAAVGFGLVGIRRVGRVAVMVFLLRGEEALAQTPPVTPPRATEMAPAPYPAGATGPATVILELEVDREGHVASSHAVAGAEPFMTAAVATSSAWRFTPALRGARPVSVRIRVRVDFKPPPAPTPTTRAKPRPPPQAPEGVEEVLIRGVRPEQPAQTLTG